MIRGQAFIAIALSGALCGCAKISTSATYSCGYGDDWQTVFTDPANHVVDANGMAVDALGNIFLARFDWVVGSTYSITQVKAADLFAGSTAAGTVLDSITNPTKYAVAMNVSIDPAGSIWAAGTIGTAGNTNERGIVRKSADGGATWSEVDSYTGADIGGSGATSNHIEAYSNGRALIVGYVDTPPQSDAFARYTTDGGANWTNIDQFNATAGQQTGAVTGIQLPSGTVVHGGFAYSDGVHFDAYSRSGKPGSSFTGGTYIPAGSTTSGFQTFAYSPATGALFAGGYVFDAASDTSFAVFRSLDEGKTWTEIWRELYSVGNGAWNASIGRILIDAEGNLFVVGWALGSDGYDHALVYRGAQEGSGTWTKTLDNLGPTSQGAWFYDAAFDAYGNLIAAGGMMQPNGSDYAGFVMRLTCEPR